MSVRIKMKSQKRKAQESTPQKAKKPKTPKMQKYMSSDQLRGLVVKYQKDNEKLAAQVDNLLRDNARMLNTIRELRIKYEGSGVVVTSSGLARIA